MFPLGYSFGDLYIKTVFDIGSVRQRTNIDRKLLYTVLYTHEWNYNTYGRTCMKSLDAYYA
jgi:hypothetical protein